MLSAPKRSLLSVHKGPSGGRLLVNHHPRTARCGRAQKGKHVDATLKERDWSRELKELLERLRSVGMQTKVKPIPPTPERSLHWKVEICSTQHARPLAWEFVGSPECIIREMHENAFLWTVLRSRAASARDQKRHVAHLLREHGFEVHHLSVDGSGLVRFWSPTFRWINALYRDLILCLKEESSGVGANNLRRFRVA